MRRSAAVWPKRPAGVRGVPIVVGVGALLSAVAVAVALANSDAEHRVIFAISHGLTVGVFILVGVFAWQRDPESGFGRLLALAGVGWFVVSLGSSSASVLFSVGMVAAWVMEVVMIYLFLSYPRDRPQGRPARAVVVLAVLIVAFLYLPMTFLVDDFPSPSPYAICADDCPANALQLTDTQPAFVADVVRPLREVLAAAIFLSTALILLHRLGRATRLMRRTLAPVLIGAALTAAAACAYLVARLADAGEGTLEALAIVRALTFPVAGLGFLVSLVEWQLYEARALERVVLSSGADHVSPARLRGLLAGALEDPSLELRFRRAGGWSGSDGEPAVEPMDSPDRCAVRVDGTAVICDPALNTHRPLVRAVGAWVSIAVDHDRLNDLLEHSLREVEDSRRRLATAAATERRRIERDLHDGAQQRLVTLRVQLELADEELRRDPVAGAARLHELGSSIDAVIDEVRSLARGIYPPLLADAGLVEALRAVAAREAFPMSVEAENSLRYPLEVESAAYFCCLEAMQNASKHSGVGAVTVTVRADPDRLRFMVADAGCGFVDNGTANGSGLTNMRDRMAAVQGRLDIESGPGAGTRVSGEVPARASS